MEASTASNSTYSFEVGMTTKTLTSGICVVLMLSAAAWAMPLGSSARTVIPSDIQQIISVDYRALKNSEGPCGEWGSIPTGTWSSSRSRLIAAANRECEWWE